MSDAREKAIAKLAEITKTPAYVIRAVFDDLGLVAAEQRLVDAVRTADADAVSSSAFDPCDRCGKRRSWEGLTECPSCATRLALADEVVKQLKPSGGGDT